MADYCQPSPQLTSSDGLPNSELRLPLLPLDDRVVLAHMTVPVAVDSESARAAVLAARQMDGLVVLVRRLAGRFARLGNANASSSLFLGQDEQVVCLLRHRVANPTELHCAQRGPVWTPPRPI
jgi:hypothetical protein